MRLLNRVSVLIVLLAVASSVPVVTAEPGGFERMASSYEVIRQALLHDTTDGVSEQAENIRKLANAQVGPDTPEELVALLTRIGESAHLLRTAAGIEEARTVFGDLSKLLVQYRQIVGESASVVAFCSMAKKVWLQPDRTIGNPYYGQSMASCGEIVSQ